MLGGARASQSHSSEIPMAGLGLGGATSGRPGMTGSESLSILLFRVVMLEFAAVTLTAYATSLIYGGIVRHDFPAAKIYLSSALLIAFLILFVF